VYTVPTYVIDIYLSVKGVGCEHPMKHRPWTEILTARNTKFIDELESVSEGYAEHFYAENYVYRIESVKPYVWFGYNRNNFRSIWYSDILRDDLFCSDDYVSFESVKNTLHKHLYNALFAWGPWQECPLYDIAIAQGIHLEAVEYR